MKSKNKIRLMILALGWYVTATTWFGAWLYNNYVTDNYEVAFWITAIVHWLSLYIVAAHYSIEGE